MLQRAYDDDEDPAAGFWEFPGGRLDDGEEALDAARREWAEETHLQVPDGDLTGLWNAGNGRYRGFVLTVPSEDAIDILGDRDEVDNPDDPDGDQVESLAWWDPRQLKDNPAVRPELSGDVKRVRRALKSAGNAETLREYWTHEAHGGPTNFAYADAIKWGTPGDFMRAVNLLMEHAHMTEEQAKGYANLMHHRALGYWPAQHAQMEGKGG
jgi:8-oxo-dGTP pyrophosphatase MutT (NUDIX family)